MSREVSGGREKWRTAQMFHGLRMAPRPENDRKAAEVGSMTHPLNDGVFANTNDFDHNVNLNALASPVFDEENELEQGTVRARQHATTGCRAGADPSGPLSGKSLSATAKPEYLDGEFVEEANAPSELTKFLSPNTASQGDRRNRLGAELANGEDPEMAALQAQFERLAKHAEDVLRINKELRQKKYLQQVQHHKELGKLKHQCLGVETKVRLLKRQLKDRKPRRHVPRAPKLTLHERMNRRFAEEAISDRPAWSSRVNPNSFRYQFNRQVSLLASEGRGGSRAGSPWKKGASSESPPRGSSPRSASIAGKNELVGFERPPQAAWVAPTPLESRKKLHNIYTITTGTAKGKKGRKSRTQDLATRPAFTSTVGNRSFRLRENKRAQVVVSPPSSPPQKQTAVSHYGSEASSSSLAVAARAGAPGSSEAKTVKITLME